MYALSIARILASFLTTRQISHTSLLKSFFSVSWLHPLPTCIMAVFSSANISILAKQAFPLHISLSFDKQSQAVASTWKYHSQSGCISVNISDSFSTLIDFFLDKFMMDASHNFDALDQKWIGVISILKSRNRSEGSKIPNLDSFLNYFPCQF